MTTKVYCPTYDSLMSPVATMTSAHRELRRRLMRSSWYRAGRNNSSLKITPVGEVSGCFVLDVECEGTVQRMSVSMTRWIKIIPIPTKPMWS